MNNNIKKIDKLLKEKRTFLFNKYQEYFEKTDWYCKSSEMVCYAFIYTDEENSISLEYKNFFDIDSITDINNEIPKLSLSGSNPELENRILDMIYSDDIVIGETTGMFILNELWFNENTVKEMIKKYLERKRNEIEMEKDMHAQFMDKQWNNIIKEKEISDNEITYTFFNEELFKIIYDRLYYIEFNSLDELYNIDLKKELLIKNTLFNSIQDTLDVSTPQLFVLNDMIIKSISINIYSYVFWPYRNHDYTAENIETVFQLVESDLKTWDYSMDEEG